MPIVCIHLHTGYIIVSATKKYAFYRKFYLIECGYCQVLFADIDTYINTLAFYVVND